MYRYYTIQIDRKPINELITKENLSFMSQLKSLEDSHTEPTKFYPIKTTSEIVEFLNTLDKKISVYCGCNGAPLSYLV